VGKERSFFIHTIILRKPIGDSLEKIISILGKIKDFHSLNFENAYFCVKEEENSKILIC